MDNGSFKLLQPLLIDNILTVLGFNAWKKPKDIPALLSKILQRDVEGPTHVTSWDYR